MKLKICGMKYQENILDVAALSPDYMGFIFYENSPRSIDTYIPDIPKSIKKVGVFVNESLENVKKKAAQYNLNTVQLHGHEAPEFCRKLKNEGLEIIKVFSIRNEFDFSRLSAYEPFIDFFLFDTKGPNPGGNGFCFDWSVLQEYNSNKPYFLSGGIGVEQLESLKKFKNSTAAKQCYAIDINSKFELKPGLKDGIKLKNFIQQL
ncbi:MAG: N-(5'-phosphoribosyl)anthranilate isomerase [Formosa sp. Hel3_A1_48]|jgi:phosphoribosylanthranilate isomerase|nr:MAG: N-(5'-phosphoribosyl)anthranilate isomerase [Formosa sp. Hel3_A1_48]